jgi:chloride channel protein, CIC family
MEKKANMPDADRGSGNGQCHMLVLALSSLVVGAASGLVGAAFRLLLDQADRFRNVLIAQSDDWHFAGCLLIVIICAGATGLAAWLVRRFSPYASGSGIPHVEAVLNEQLPYGSFWLIPIKFVGGVLAIGSGLALGREGPSVQMGASLSLLIGKYFKLNWPDCRTLFAAGAGAGLATAFNAPIAGAIFVLEELFRRFDTRITIATLGASAAAIGVSRAFLGQAPDFQVEPLSHPGVGTVPIHLVLGIVAGLVGIAYNRAILGAFVGSGQLQRIPVEARAAAVGAVVGLIACLAPNVVGGGDVITQQTLAGSQAASVILLMFLARFVLGAVSYAARTPGGLFAPMLVLGAQAGVLFGMLCSHLFPGYAPDPIAVGIVGMAAFFTAVVRAPVTGIVLVIEMTGSFNLLLPMIGACFMAMAVPTLLGNPPIYESLRDLTLKGATGKASS